MEPKKPPDLPENKFIREGYTDDPTLLWYWFFFLAMVIAVIWGAGSWYNTYLNEQQTHRPFLQVTNREISSFLWQHPEYMRANAKTKSGYLPAFQYLERVSVEPNLADQYVNAPPELLFQYHTWNRLLGDVYFPRPIPAGEFVRFLNYCEEWQPQYWKAAPQEYKDTIEALSPTATLDLQQLPESTLPRAVRIAFQGWKNFMIEGPAINAYKPTYRQVAQLIAGHPTYARNYWQNLFDGESQNYLKSIAEHPVNDDEVPDSEIPAFVRIALFNAQRVEAK